MEPKCIHCGQEASKHSPEPNLGMCMMPYGETYYTTEEVVNVPFYSSAIGGSLSRCILLEQISREVDRSKMHGEQFVSMHEAYGVIFEELEEFWEICRLKRRDRDREKIKAELVQLAAMAVKALESIDNFVGGDL